MYITKLELVFYYKVNSPKFTGKMGDGWEGEAVTYNKKTQA